MVHYKVRIQKETETPLLVTYRFGLGEMPMGRLSLRKTDGYVEEIVPVFHPKGRAIFARAMHRILDHWGRSEYPDLTYWESDETK
ncbi:MAG: hypothetical protein ACOY94_07500 [Bacillota bacterium]